MTTPITSLGPSWPASCGAPAGSTHAERGQQALEWFVPAYALFLLAVEPTVYWSYSWWYSVDDGIFAPATPADANSTSAPVNWYPDLQKPLGAPAGPAARVPGGSGWVYTRTFDHAVVTVDLSNWRGATIAWQQDGAAKPPPPLQAATYTNPVLDADFPDPVVVRAADGTFWAYATMGNGHHLQHSSSPDLVHWSAPAEAMPTPPPWAAGGCFWAPDVQRHNTSDGGEAYFMYFAASTNRTAGGQCIDFCIGVATSATPDGPFANAAPPLLCEAGFTALDPQSFFDSQSGQTYLLWGSDGAPISVRALAPERTAWAAGSAAVALLPPDASRPYESLVEGAWLHYHAGSYFLLTSGDACCGGGAHYAVIASRAPHPTGPFTRRGDADGTGRDTLLAQRGSGSDIAAPGHNCMVTDDAGNDWIVYHGYVGGNLNGPRALQLDRVHWSAPNGTASPVGVWPAVLDGTPSTTPQAVPVINNAVKITRA